MILKFTSWTSRVRCWFQAFEEKRSRFLFFSNAKDRDRLLKTPYFINLYSRENPIASFEKKTKRARKVEHGTRKHANAVGWNLIVARRRQRGERIRYLAQWNRARRHRNRLVREVGLDSAVSLLFRTQRASFVVRRPSSSSGTLFRFHC